MEFSTDRAIFVVANTFANAIIGSSRFDPKKDFLSACKIGNMGSSLHLGSVIKLAQHRSETGIPIRLSKWLFLVLNHVNRPLGLSTQSFLA